MDESWMEIKKRVAANGHDQNKKLLLESKLYLVNMTNDCLWYWDLTEKRKTTLSKNELFDKCWLKWSEICGDLENPSVK